MAEKDEGEKKSNKIRKQGGFKTIPFILANEACDRFAAAGFNANMITYLTQQLHMPMVQASNTLTNFGGTSSLTPIIGALIADSFAGRFWTITAGSLIYQLGMLTLTLSALLPSLRPPPCTTTCQPASTFHLLILYASLLFTSIGTGGIRPCVVAFGADQFDLRRSSSKWSFFNLYFFTMGLAHLLALTVVVYIQENIGWGWGLGIPTLAMSISVAAFVIGYPLYLKLKPGGSPLTRLTQVAVAAFKKRNTPLPSDPDLLYQNKHLDADISTTGRLLHTNHLRFLDHAAVVASGDTDTGLWRLSTVHRVEELKSIVRMIPIWAVGILSATAGSHGSTFAIQQARSMDRHVTANFQIPPASMSLFAVAAMLLGLAFYDRVFVPVARRFTGRPSGITYLQRMGIGLAIALMAPVAAALVEGRRKAAAERYGLLDDDAKAAVVPMSVFWLVPQYAIHGIGDSFMSVGHMEFLYDQAPESMRSTAAALFWLAGSMGSYMGTFMVTVVSNATRGGGEWLQDDINRGKLEYYYWLVTGLQVLNLVYYLVCAKFYTFKPLEVVRSEDDQASKFVGDGGDVELASVVVVEEEEEEEEDGRVIRRDRC